jgi:hypothetical protein
MSDDLGAVIRALAQEESAAAASEFPYSLAVLNRFAAGVRRRRAARTAALAVVVLPILGGAAFGLGQLIQAGPVEPGGTPSVTLSPTLEASPTPSASPSASPSPSPSPSTSGPTTTITTATTTTTAPPPPPAEPPVAVSGLRAQPGGGSGEIVVNWAGSPGATGYRVYRASAPGDPMKLAATYTVASGATTVSWPGSYEFIQVWAPSASSFEYVEAVDGHPGYFVVAAFSDAGEGPLQGTVCAVPLGSPDSC